MSDYFWQDLRRDEFDALTAERDAALAERDAALARVAEYEQGITWGTTCLNCSKLTSACYDMTVRAEKAEATVERVRAMRDRYADEGNEVCHRSDDECTVVVDDLTQILDGE